MKTRTSSRSILHTITGLALALAATTFLATPAYAQGDSPWAVGLQGGVPLNGLSARYDMSDKLTAQGILGAEIDLAGISGRLNYRFRQEEKYAIFGFGAVSLYSWSGTSAFAAETAVGFAGGAGVELPWPEIIEDDEFPPLLSTVELGYGYAGFSNFSLTPLTLQASIHWEF